MAPDFIGDRGISALPGLESRFRQAVDDIATLSAPFLATANAPLIALAVPSDGWGGSPLLLWDQRLTPRPGRSRQLCETLLFGPALDALCYIADELFEILCAARICPRETIALTVICDGTGVAFTSAVPDPASADAQWLLTLAGRRGRAVTILPMAPDGVWALLEIEAVAASIH